MRQTLTCNTTGLSSFKVDNSVWGQLDDVGAEAIEVYVGFQNVRVVKQKGETVEAITRIDRFVCDVKDSQFGDGLHVFGRAPVAGGALARLLRRDRRSLGSLAHRHSEPNHPTRSRVLALPSGLRTSETRAFCPLGLNGPCTPPGLPSHTRPLGCYAGRADLPLDLCLQPSSQQLVSR